ncbi:MAG: choice-of-anchor D domain-containing protein [bacterium]|nr:choice-of-anchor D domain-containing protein [bacterium]
MLSYTKSRNAGKTSLQTLFFFLIAVQICFAQAPVISVTPDSLIEDLLSGKTSEQTLTIFNNGSSDLTFEINVRDNFELFLLNSTDDYSIVSSTDPLEVANIPVTDYKSYSGNSSSTGKTFLLEKNEKIYEDKSLAGGLKILLITCGGMPSEIKDALLSFPDIQQVDIFDASGSTPTINQLLPYHTVIAMDNTPYSDPVELGNILADYVDAGRGLILTVATFASGWEITGRLLEDEYFPFNIGYGPVGGATLGTFNPTHPIMQGVTSAYGDLLVDLTVANGAELVASWDTGWPFVATKGKNVVAVNIYVTEPGYWTGDIPLLLHNAAFWAGSCRWLSAEPDNGTITAGSSMDITMKFNAAGLTGGEYNANIKISSNDPVTPELIVPAHLSITDAPAIWTNTDNINFGEVFLGVSDTFYLEVRNIGSQDLLIINSAIQPTEYTVSPAFAGIDPGGSEIFTISFLPTQAGNYPGTLTLTNNDPLYDNYVVDLSGQGVEPPIIVVSPDSLVVGVLPGSTRTKILTISNQGESNLYFNIIGGFSSTNYALQFDGVDDLVEVQDNASLDISTELTIEAWAKVDYQQFYTNPAIVCKYIHPISGYSLNLFSYINNPMTLEFRDLNSNWCYVSSLTTGLNDFTWHHFAGTFDGVKLRIYIDGILDNTSPDYVTSILSNDLNLAIGGVVNIQQWFNGFIDEVRIWNVARSQLEIQNSMYKQLNNIEPGLVAYWQFDEGTGTITYDKTANANNGTLNGGVQWTDVAPLLQPGWFLMSTDSGVCLPHTSMDIELLFNATELDTGDYYAAVIVKSNDPFTPSVIVPIHMKVSTSVGVGDGLNTPMVFNLDQNYPNPFNPNTTIKYSIPELSKVKLTLFNLLGEEITTLVNEEKVAGNYSIEFSAASLPSGVYFYRIQAGSFVDTKKMILIK